MADLEKTKTDPEHQLWEQMDELKAGMLGVFGGEQHFQPMSPNVDRVDKSIWFYANKTSDLVKAVGDGADARFMIIGKSQDYYASLRGRLTVNKDPARIEEFWSSVVAAWFESREDPNIMMLEFNPDSAAIWAATGNPLAFGWQIAKSNLSDTEPDVGVQTELTF